MIIPFDEFRYRFNATNSASCPIFSEIVPFILLKDMPIALKDDKFRIDVGSGPEKEFRESS